MKKFLCAMLILSFAWSCTTTQTAQQQKAIESAELLLPDDTAAVITPKGKMSLSSMNITEVWTAYRPALVALQIIIAQYSPKIGNGVLIAIRVIDTIIIRDYSWYGSTHLRKGLYIYNLS